MAHDVFISHSSTDRAIAHAACDALEAAGVRCWIAPRDIRAGVVWGAAVMEAIRNSRVMVVVFSAQTNGSPQVLREVERAVTHGVVLITFRVQDVPPADALEFFLSSPQWVDAFDGPADKNIRALTRMVLLALGREQDAAALEAKAPSPGRPVTGASAASASDDASPGKHAAGDTTSALAAVGSGPRPRAESRTRLAFAAILLLGLGILAAALLRGRAGITATEAKTSGGGAGGAGTAEGAGGTPGGETTAAAHEQRVRGAFVNGLGMRLVEVGAGEFRMGSPPTEQGRYDDESLHTVRITRPFFIGAHEVTRAQFAAFVNKTGYRTDAEKLTPYELPTAESGGRGGAAPEPTWRDPSFPQADDHPVVCVSWNDATAFCRWLGDAERRPYRLPTEAEWEMASRAGSRTAYPWGDRPDGGLGACNAADLTAAERYPTWTTFKWSDGYLNTSPVGTFRPNGYGVYDAIGNAWEWCADWHAYYPTATVTDPAGPPAGTQKVLRGGSWNAFPDTCRTANRRKYPPARRADFTGFRVALSR